MPNKTKAALASALFLISALPLSALAQTSSRQTQGNVAQTTERFCSTLPQYSSTVTARLGDGGSRIAKMDQGDRQSLQARLKSRDEQLKEVRQKSDADREIIYDNLREKADSEAKKLAVEDFRQAVEAAVLARKAAVDAAMQAYRSGVESVLAARKTVLEAARKNFENALKAALVTAKTECASGVPVRTVRQNFVDAVEAARNKFASERDAVDRAGEQISALAKTRNEAVRLALEDFKKAMELARKTFKTAQ